MSGTESESEIPRADDVVTADDVAAARDRIESEVHRTPLDRSTTFAEWSGAASVGLKLENLQRTGSFKIRGAYNTMAQLPPERRERGVVASSAGNHAQGVALAAKLLGIDATIVVPEITPAAKVDATRGYGAEVVVEGRLYERSYERALELGEEEGLTFVHPFNDDGVIAGQGTVGLELAEQYPELDAAVVSVGGGGLISGVATALKANDPDVRVIGVQPEGAAHAAPSLEKGEIHRLSEVDTVAEGIADARLLERTLGVMRERVDEVVSVTDTQLAEAVAMLAERAKTVAEAAGAAPVAALLSGAVDVEGEHVACVISGGNANLGEHAELAERGLRARGRYATFRVALEDWPGGVADVTDAVEDAGAELDGLRREEWDADAAVNRRVLSLDVSGSGPDHLRGLAAELDAREGVDVVSDDLTDARDGDGG